MTYEIKNGKYATLDERECFVRLFAYIKNTSIVLSFMKVQRMVYKKKPQIFVHYTRGIGKWTKDQSQLFLTISKKNIIEVQCLFSSKEIII